MTSSGTRFAAAEEEIKVSMNVMHELRSVVSNLIKLSRPPDGIREADECRRANLEKGG